MRAANSPVAQALRMVFGLESDMVVPVRRWLCRRHLMVRNEFALPWGICDFVGLLFDRARVNRRLHYGQRAAIGPLHRIDLLNHIPEQEAGPPLTMDELIARMPSTYMPMIETEVQKLVDGRFVIKNTDGSLYKLNGWVPLHRRIVAVELKLSRVAEALAQAALHKSFADESYVAMPAPIAKRLATSPRASEFEAQGVGVLAVSTANCSVVLTPSPHGLALDPTLQMHCAERFWRTRDSSS